MTPQTHECLSARRDLSGPGLAAFFNICEKWGLTSDEARILLGRPARSTFYRWRRTRTGALTNDVLERISYVLGIYRSLHIHFAAPAQADGWIKRANAAPLFAGSSALDRMIGGQVADLYVVRQYLDAQRGWG
jgi:hypothetical protein